MWEISLLIPSLFRKNTSRGGQWWDEWRPPLVSLQSVGIHSSQVLFVHVVGAMSRGSE